MRWDEKSIKGILIKEYNMAKHDILIKIRIIYKMHKVKYEN